MNENYPLSVQIAEVEREITMRERVYAGLISRGKMKRADADHQIAIMREVLVSLQWLKAL